MSLPLAAYLFLISGNHNFLFRITQNYQAPEYTTQVEKKPNQMVSVAILYLEPHKATVGEALSFMTFKAQRRNQHVFFAQCCDTKCLVAKDD